MPSPLQFYKNNTYICYGLLLPPNDSRKCASTLILPDPWDDEYSLKRTKNPEN